MILIINTDSFWESRQLLTSPALRVCVGKKSDTLHPEFSTSHDFLTGKLSNYGLDEPTVRWIENHLNNRFQMVVITGTGSSRRPVAGSVPHRSILGPVLFNL